MAKLQKTTTVKRTAKKVGKTFKKVAKKVASARKGIISSK